MCYGWYRYRNLPVLTTNKTGSFIQHRYDHIRNIQIIHTYRYCSNIYNGIYSTNFMKMNFFDRNSMRFGFCLRQDVYKRQAFILIFDSGIPSASAIFLRICGICGAIFGFCAITVASTFPTAYQMCIRDRYYLSTRDIRLFYEFSYPSTIR